MSDIKIAFWNLQNLFDTTVSEIAADLEFTPEHGWTEERLNQKIDNLALIIKSLHSGNGPDILGICEIENDGLTQKLIEKIGRQDYKIVHAPSPDIRGIDVALIYSNNILEQVGDAVPHLVHFRYPTRDILEVKFKVKENNSELIVYVNHWPSRRAGKYETEPLRIALADYCGRLVDEQLKIQRKDYIDLANDESTLKLINDNWDKNMILMGDFNDEPFDRSIMDYLQSSKDLDHLEEGFGKSGNSFKPEIKNYLAREAYLFNCMWVLLGNSDTGSHYFSQSVNPMNMLDQFIISRGLYFGKQKLQIDIGSIKIFTEIMSCPEKRRPKPFDKQTGQGFSDHYPVETNIKIL
jgi:predicted extracellular nuclease